MSDENDKQYRPIAITETGYQNSLSVRFFKDMARNVNNFKDKFAHKLVADNWPIENDMQSENTVTAITDEGMDWSYETIRMVYAPRFVPDGYTRLLVQSLHHRTTGAGNTTWRLRVVDRFYNSIIGAGRASFFTKGAMGGPQWITTGSAWAEFDTSVYSVLSTASWVSDSGTVSLASNIIDTDFRNRRGEYFMVLTSQNSTITTISRLFNLDVTPRLGD